MVIKVLGDCKIFVQNEGGVWVARTRINGRNNVPLLAVHMQMKVNRGDMPTTRAFVRMPAVDYVEVFGADFAYERIEV